MSVLKMLVLGNSAQEVPGSGSAEAVNRFVVMARPAMQPAARHATTRVFLGDTKLENVVRPCILLSAPAASSTHPRAGGFAGCYFPQREAELGWSLVIHRPSDPATVERLRRLCMALAGVTEKLSHGEPAWFVRGKQFATVADHHHDDRLSVWLAAAPMTQEAIIDDDPRHFFRPPYVGHRGWLGVYLDMDDVDWLVVDRLVREAHQLVAPTTRTLGGAGGI